MNKYSVERKADGGVALILPEDIAFLTADEAMALAQELETAATGGHQMANQDVQCVLPASLSKSV
jgi:hypothetical protein